MHGRYKLPKSLMEKPILVLKRRAFDKALKEVETKCINETEIKETQIELAPQKPNVSSANCKIYSVVFKEKVSDVYLPEG